MEDWFTIERIDDDSFVISEMKAKLRTHCYLLCGRKCALMIDTGLGIGDMASTVHSLTDLPVIAAPTHLHWDHIGGLKGFADFCAHEAELSWLNGHYPLPIQTVRAMLQRSAPPWFDVASYRLFQGTPTRLVADGDVIDLGGRWIEALHTPGHSPGHLCWFDRTRGWVFTGDLIYKGTLVAFFPTTDPQAYLRSLEKVAALPVKRLLPAHGPVDIAVELLSRMCDGFRWLNQRGLLHHGSGRFRGEGWAVQL